MVNLTLEEGEALNIARWLLNQPNLPYGLASIAHLLMEESDIRIEVTEDDRND